jgi:hypothetical protein
MPTARRAYAIWPLRASPGLCAKQRPPNDRDAADMQRGSISAARCPVPSREVRAQAGSDSPRHDTNWESPGLLSQNDSPHLRRCRCPLDTQRRGSAMSSGSFSNTRRAGTVAGRTSRVW